MLAFIPNFHKIRIKKKKKKKFEISIQKSIFGKMCYRLSRKKFPSLFLSFHLEWRRKYRREIFIQRVYSLKFNSPWRILHLKDFTLGHTFCVMLFVKWFVSFFLFFFISFFLSFFLSFLLYFFLSFSLSFFLSFFSSLFLTF